jgi:hypothetical protein
MTSVVGSQITKDFFGKKKKKKLYMSQRDASNIQSLL